MTYDEITTLSHSKIQHGKYNDRIYLFKLGKNENIPEVTRLLDELARTKGYTKIFAKIPMESKLQFLVDGYQQEAMIPAFYSGEKPAAFVVKYFSESRRQSLDNNRIQKILTLAKEKAGTISQEPSEYSQFEIRRLTEENAKEMTEIYQEVFESYPFPIHSEEYIKQTMASHIHYYGVLKGDEIVALSSSEFDFDAQNVEMTDFATRPEYLGNGFAVSLLKHMEIELTESKIKTAYTIARALSAGMNITFARLGYQFGGTLVNNTNISGSIESMNIWYKSLI